MVLGYYGMTAKEQWKVAILWADHSRDQVIAGLAALAKKMEAES